MKRLLVLAALVALQPVGAQRGGGRGGGFNGACSFSYDESGYFRSPFFAGNPVYDGHVTFARIKYSGGFECGPEGPGWAHDYPRTDSHFMNIMKSITSIVPFVEKGPIIGSTVLRLDEPDLLKYPVAYMSEPGGWQMSDAEVKGLKQYISRGGFIIFDDMGNRGRPDIQNLLSQWQRAFPNTKLVELHNDHPIFKTFFNVDLTKIPGYYGYPQYFGIYENNDPAKRLVAVIDNNNDIGEYIEFSDEGFQAVPATESYKLWVNYFMYALTH